MNTKNKTLLLFALCVTLGNPSIPAQPADPNSSPGSSPLVVEFTTTLAASNHVPPLPDRGFGRGTFLLHDMVLDYEVWTPITLRGAFIHGPAGPDANAPVLFELHFSGCAAPGHTVPYTPGGCVYRGNLALSAGQVEELLNGLWYVNVPTIAFPEGELRGQILPVIPDADGDDVPDHLDQCPDTPTNAVVDATGCSIAQLCPCGGPWRNHGHYVRAVMQTALRFHREGLITRADAHAIIRDAARSDCGNPPSRPRPHLPVRPRK